MIWILLVLFIIILYGFLFFKKMHIRLNYTFMLDGDHEFNMSMEIFGIKIKSKRLNLRSLDSKSRGDASLLDMIFNRQKVDELKAVLVKVDVRDLACETAIGTGDVISTGIATGMLWSIKQSSLLMLEDILNLRCVPLLKVHSNYQGVIFQTRIECYLVLPFYMTFRFLKK